MRGGTKRVGISSGSACAIQMMRGRISWRKWPYEVGYTTLLPTISEAMCRMRKCAREW